MITVTENEGTTETRRYEQWLFRQEREWEEACNHCGSCCGAYEGDPCVHWEAREDGSGRCGIYAARFGWRRTISGRRFRCVPVRDILHKSWPGDHLCVYKKKRQ